jgi:undecaprenyl-diphosphatase
MTFIKSSFRILHSRADLSTLAAVGFLAGALFVFVKTADVVIEGNSHRLDEMLLRLLRNPSDLADPMGPRWVEVMLKDLTTLGGTTVLTLITILAAGYLLVDRKPGAAVLILASVGGGTILSSLLKNAFARRVRSLLPIWSM